MKLVLGIELLKAFQGTARDLAKNEGNKLIFFSPSYSDCSIAKVKTMRPDDSLYVRPGCQAEFRA